MLYVSNLSPRIVGLNGTLQIRCITAEKAGKLIYQHRATYKSLVTFEATCDVLATIAGLEHFHRQRDLKSVDLTIRDSDLYLIVSIKEAAKAKSNRSLGVFDFDYTLCEFRAQK